MRRRELLDHLGVVLLILAVIMIALFVFLSGDPEVLQAPMR